MPELSSPVFIRHYIFDETLGGGDGIQSNCSYNNIIRDNTVANGYIGIYLDTSNNNLVVGNNVNGSFNGIGLFSATGNTLRGNIVRRNSIDGFGLLKFSNDDNITDNTVEDNCDFGIYLQDSGNNAIYLNTFRNFKNAQSKDLRSQGSSSIWQSPEPVKYLTGNESR